MPRDQCEQKDEEGRYEREGIAKKRHHSFIHLMVNNNQRHWNEIKAWIFDYLSLPLPLEALKSVNCLSEKQFSLPPGTPNPQPPLPYPIYNFTEDVCATDTSVEASWVLACQPASCHVERVREGKGEEGVGAATGAHATCLIF